MQVLTEFGLGTSLRRGDYTEASARALRDLLWKASINAAEWLGREKSEMRLAVRVAVQQPDLVDRAELQKVFPYGEARIEVVFGGLDVPRPEGHGNPTVMALAALTVSFEEAAA
ncbi:MULTISPECIES: Lin0512 family protein [unclassified Mameliella]|uniref:Lin0512 family protein n=1 Tax=unclassified Mameliella TaxID=2630630 RepID=UPI00273DCFA3|nr:MULTISPECIES: Lin0512 family protein [unclassified Mameliella]